MDFSDFSDFIGPIIFGIIAWLSNYFSKKKKPNQETPDNLKNTDEKTNKFEEIILGNLKPNKTEEKPIDDIEIIENKEEEIIENIEVNKNDLKPKNQNYKTKKENINNSETKKNNLSRLKDKLKNKNSLKEAVILKEILDRKY
tara:strand:- start:130 stop:558 length:429 start_codon:yes stop_codon:yes gene_type:complete